MSRKTLIWIGLFVGSAIGEFIPALWGASMFSMSSVLLSAICATIGVYLGVKFGD